MASGRVKESTLKVFGNDYPTQSVLAILKKWFPPIQMLHTINSSDGTCVRDYLHVVDLAAGHLLALDALAPGSSFASWNPSEGYFKAYNLGKGNGLSVLDILEAMRKATGFDYKYEIIGRRYVIYSA